jgi:hypothetical protein
VIKPVIDIFSHQAIMQKVKLSLVADYADQLVLVDKMRT